MTLFNHQFPKINSPPFRYMFEGRGPRMRQALAHLELELFELAKIGQFSDLFDIHLYGDEIANFEMMRGSQQTIRLLAIGIGAMVAFMLVAFRQYKWKSQVKKQYLKAFTQF
jgi:hypothetical protein